MDTLFTANVIINGESKGFDVHFENDEYIFNPEDEGEAFSLARLDDGWKVNGNLPEIAQGQAIHALETYLLAQH